jgi:hypothetical protein
MSLYLFCPRKSTGAEELIKLLRANRLKKFDGLHFWDNGLRFVLKDGDTIINWGGSIPELDGIRVLNPYGKMTKYEELYKLAKFGLRVPPMYQTSPGVFGIPRGNYGKNDLLNPPDNPTWYTIKEDYTRELRIHVFNQRSIRAGERIPREGFQVHPWIRTYEGGWRLNYEGVKSTKKLRDISYAAVEALGLTFGAVDLAELFNGTVKVIGVNRAPNISGATLQAYVRAINKWLLGGINESVPGRDETTPQIPDF